MYLKNFGKAKTIFKERSFKEDGASSSWKEMFKEEELARRERKRREEEEDALADLFSDFETSIEQESQDHLEQGSDLGSPS